ncbi:hypothetical protein H2248_003740 [Termitomyces sp. 'cryptogamus']|nr:hypothetical protein H2248_003740 [Termitomyces sp. 'cryptogamus']
MSLNKYPPPVFPPINQNAFLSDVIDFNIINNPQQPFYIFVDPCKGSQVITQLEFGRAAHRIAHALRPQRAGRDGEVVAILAHTDTIIYSTIITGAIVAGIVPFPISVRNTPVAVAEMLMKTSCHRLLATSAVLKTLIDETKARLASFSYEVQIEEIPSPMVAYPQLAHETADYPFESYPAPSHRPIAMDTCMIVHSSGSTGIPKPILQSHLYVIQLAANLELRDYVPRLVLGSMALPAFHAFGIAYQIIRPAYNVLACAVFPPMSVSGGSPVVPSPNIVLEHVKATKTNTIFTIPAFIQAWSTSPDSVEYLRSLEFIAFSGGPLAPKLGDKLASLGLQLYPFYGGTEFGGATFILRDKAKIMEWEYMRFFPQIKVRWVPQGDDLYECQILACETFRPVLNNLPDVEGFATADIFKPHPTKEGLWKIVGRADDVIVHSSGEKTIPGPMEVIIMSNPRIGGAIIFGREHTQAGVLIELAPEVEIDFTDEAQLTFVRNELWPTIDEANNVAPAFSKIFKEMILFASREKPLPRADKGTVMRKAALKLYNPEISALYNNVEANIAGNSCPQSWDIVDVQSWILEQAIELTSKDGISLDTDLFDQGFDSLSATVLRLRISHAMRSSEDSLLVQASQKVDQNLVYNMPTIKKLATYVTSTPGLKEQVMQPLTGNDLIEELIAKYSVNLEPYSIEGPPRLLARNSGLVVLLTGSTGHLGSQILANLLKEDRISRIYAFNRDSRKSKSLLDRHVERFTDIGINLSLLQSEKLHLITGDATRADLGIEEGLYREISSSINVVIHNAWQIDFNLPLMLYEPHIKSSRHFIDLVRAGPNASQARFLFISSIASAQSWDDTRGPVIEDVVEPSSAIGSGYGEAKFVVERMLVNSGLQATSLRLGQICGGGPKGSWPTSEWFPLLVKSSVKLGVLPSSTGVVAWLPADSMAQAIIDIALHPLPNSLPRVLNVVHPQPIELSVIVNGVVSAINDVLGIQLRTVPFDRWLSLIEAQADKVTPDNLKMMPAIKLIGFFRRNAVEQLNRVFSTKTTQSISTTLHPTKLKQIGHGDVKTWVQYWNGVGYFTGTSQGG